jgi:hypothetical protein
VKDPGQLVEVRLDDVARRLPGDHRHQDCPLPPAGRDPRADRSLRGDAFLAGAVVPRRLVSRAQRGPRPAASAFPRSRRLSRRTLRFTLSHSEHARCEAARGQ